MTRLGAYLSNLKKYRQLMLKEKIRSQISHITKQGYLYRSNQEPMKTAEYLEWAYASTSKKRTHPKEGT
jgi:hypothetical protein